MLLLKIFALLVAGALFGFLGARVIFVGSPLSLVPWTIASVLIGFAATNWAKALGGGAIFGFTIVLSFIAFGYQGSQPFVDNLLAFSLIGCVGAVCAAGAAAMGRFVRSKTSRRPRVE